MLRIDTHTHWVPPSFAEALREGASRSPRFAHGAGMLVAMLHADSPVVRLDSRLREMDECALDVCVVSLPPPGATFGDRRVRRRIARAANDEMLEAADKFPDRLVVLITLPLPSPEDSIAELDRVAGHPRARGVGLLTVSSSWQLDDPRLEPVYRRIAELGLPIVTHPAVEPLPSAWQPWALAASLAPVVSSSLGVVRIALSGILDRVPDLELVVPHLGGTLPYVAQRIADFGTGDGAHDLLFYLRNRIYLDTCSFHRPAFRCAAETAGLERLVLGSDYPFRGPLARAIRDVEECVSDAAARDAILGGTAARWFGDR